MADETSSCSPNEVTGDRNSSIMQKHGIVEPTSSGDGSIDLNPVGPEQQPMPSTIHQLSLDDVEAVDVKLRDLSVTVDTSPSLMDPTTYPALIHNIFNKDTNDVSHRKVLLNSINASFKPGTLTAILGGSGSGKTTLLNTIADRVFSTRLSKTGTIAFNGSGLVDSVRHAYVMQQDVLLPTLTVRETLRYAADLRLPPPTTDSQRAQIVEEVILELGLKDCAGTRIGNSQHRGCSGGEKRRTSIGVQLLANPSVLFLDEPTTGLDATSAYQLVRTLKDLARKGRTIITTLHSPRSEIWDLLDNLVLLSRGSLVYSGPTNDCIPWFSNLGYELPPFVNPAEFTIDHAAIDNRTPELEEESTARVERLKAAWAGHSRKRLEPLSLENTQHNDAVPVLRKRQHRASFIRQLRVLTSRTFKVTYRDPMGMVGSILEVILMAIITGYIFFNLGRNQSGIRSREGALYISIALQGYLFLTFEIYRMSLDIATFDREKSEGCVTALPFILSRRIARLFTEDLPIPFLYSVIFYFLAGFDLDARKFFTFFAVLLLNHYISVTLAAACIAAVRHFPGASLIANLAYTLQSLACGFFIQSNTIPIYVRWTKYITYSYYGFGALCTNEFEGSFYDCPSEGGASNPACIQYTGRYILDSLGFPRDWLSRPIIAMLGFVLLFLLTSWIGLEFVNVEMTVARPRTSGTDLSTGKEKMVARSIQEVRAIDVSLEKFALKLDKRSALGKSLPTKIILEPITATFQAGMLNIIMGPSGSGKTSLLNTMAQRLNSTIATKYRSSGRLLFNGATPSSSVIQSVVSYVCQDDDALLPSLTVRETLRFAAGLRLPSWMSKQAKYQRAEEVLLKMGLKDCADNLVGSELVKGISGGEKRRVSIAVQILTDPRVLLLDEPTSGLDAFTANSIMEVLQGLANEGRTLILTIHQARSDLFKSFGNVLLLARGGSPTYSGPAKDMLGYFSTLDYHCPQHTNPADFALDLITVDLQEEQRETASREKVRKLIESWSSVVEGSQSQSVAELLSSHLKTSGGEKIDMGSSQLLANEYEDGTSDGAHLQADEHSDEKRRSQHKTDEAVFGGLPSIPTLRRSQSVHKTAFVTPAELGALVRKRASFWTAFPLLLHRAAINISRQPPLLLARTFQVIGLAIVLALFFAPLHHDYYSIQNRVGFVQEICAFYFVGMLQNVALWPAEREVFYREDDDGVYGVEAFLATYTLLELPFELVSCLVFGVLADFAVGFPRTAELYFVLVFCAFGIVSCGESLGIMFNTLFNHTGFAVNIVSILLSVSQVIAGIISIDMPRVFQIFNYLSPTKYAVAALARFSLDGIKFTCDEAQRLPDGRCPIETGEEVLELYNLDVNGVTNIIALAGTVIAYRLVAWLLLRLVRTRWKSIIELRRERRS
ncbi:P-loop containing nucleoside triphosphate hydrolase protein [Hypoxylon argillaceum]|nr:P-loop containing nucleoside triphosphate hydrolase protein [Hypoxylon argillaceum]